MVTPLNQGPTFESLDQAAHEVSKDFGKQPDVEQSAALFKGPDGRYAYSAAVSNSDHDNFGMRVGLPKGVTLAGIVHSHPGSDDLGQYFSPGDLSVANQLKVPSYIRFLKDNSIRRYTPGQSSTSYLLGSRVARGDSLNLPPPDASPPLGPKLADLNARAQSLTQQVSSMMQAQPAPAATP
jgi:hypothetical protein